MGEQSKRRKEVKTIDKNKRAIRKEKSVLISREQRSMCAGANCPRPLAEQRSVFGGRGAVPRDRVSIFKAQKYAGGREGSHPIKREPPALKRKCAKQIRCTLFSAWRGQGQAAGALFLTIAFKPRIYAVVAGRCRFCAFCNTFLYILFFIFLCERNIKYLQTCHYLQPSIFGSIAKRVKLVLCRVVQG